MIGLFADPWVVRLRDDEIEPAKATGAGLFEPMRDAAVRRGARCSKK